MTLVPAQRDPAPRAAAVPARPAETARTRYADLLMEWLVELGYTHCYFVAGGASMHLLDAARGRFVCVPFVHEVSAGIAAEYGVQVPGPVRPFVLVTAGPGMTNLVSALAGAWLESRELLVVGGQVKSADLADSGVRQRGIQEIDGVALARPVAVTAERLERPASRDRIREIVLSGRRGRPGPVFLEVCLDVQGMPVEQVQSVLEKPAGLPDDTSRPCDGTPDGVAAAHAAVPQLVELTARASRPVWLLGGGVSREMAARLHEDLGTAGVPVMTTWNGADRVARDLPTYVGRPNTWGQRSANALLSQADLVIALGTRLGLQQTGFAWEEFAPLATVVQIDLDRAEMEKGHPRVDVAVQGDADTVLSGLVAGITAAADRSPEHAAWLQFCHEVRELLPLRDPANATGDGFVCPYVFSEQLAQLLPSSAVFVPCSSGGANSVPMQVFEPARGHTMVTDPGLASMGYGLAGAVGAALAAPERPVVLVEGDGGFAQNLSELGTVAAQRLDLTIFLFCNDGYGSIRATQRNYMGGAYVGCDAGTGLGLPDWHTLFAAYGIPVTDLRPAAPGSCAPCAEQLRTTLDSLGPRAVLVPIDPDQTYWPKITSRITPEGGMVSRPLHDMSPDLPAALADRVLPYLRGTRQDYSPAH